MPKSVYRKAAEDIVNVPWKMYCCNVLNGYSCSDSKKFADTFRPNQEEIDQYGLYDSFYGTYFEHGYFGKPGEEENQLARTLALLFMEQMS